MNRPVTGLGLLHCPAAKEGLAITTMGTVGRFFLPFCGRQEPVQGVVVPAGMAEATPPLLLVSEPARAVQRRRTRAPWQEPKRWT